MSGCTVFLTGLSGAGKSTIALQLAHRLQSLGRTITLLDGDSVRRHLSSELGFSRKDRDSNILRTGFIAAEVTRHGGIAICSLIAPYDQARKEVRARVEAVGGFLLVHISTPLATCELRDAKGLYKKARAGLVPHFTGVSDPYETPSDAELVLDTTAMAPEESVELIISQLRSSGYLD